jgi:SAM-dependent methyltransferase
MTDGASPLSPDYWNARYAEDGFAYGEQPNHFLASAAGQIKPGGRVLVPGDGEGRNGVWLAQQGFAVTSVDMSKIGCEKADALARRSGVAMDVIQADLSSWDWPVAEFDAVVSIFLHLPLGIRPAIHAQMRTALVDTGILIIEAFDPSHLELRLANPEVGGPGDITMLYTSTMLTQDFAPMQAVQLEHREIDLAEGRYHRGRGSVVRGVFGLMNEMMP